METPTVAKHIDATNFDNIKAMLVSPDRENAVVAISILEQADLKQGLPYILLLIKEVGTINKSEWLDHAPKLYDKLTTWGVLDGGLSKVTFKRILELTKDNCEEAGIQYVLANLEKIIKGYLITWGLDYVEGLDLKLSIAITKQ